jgi:hypothetical protein
MSIRLGSFIEAAAASQQSVEARIAPLASLAPLPKKATVESAGLAVKRGAAVQGQTSRLYVPMASRPRLRPNAAA